MSSNCYWEFCRLNKNVVYLFVPPKEICGWDGLKTVPQMQKWDWPESGGFTQPSTQPESGGFTQPLLLAITM